MTHPLARVIADADGFVLIGDSSQDRFPAFSYHAYTTAKKRFYCVDMGGLTESRGPTKGRKVYTSIDELPEEHDDLVDATTPAAHARQGPAHHALGAASASSRTAARITASPALPSP